MRSRLLLCLGLVPSLASAHVVADPATAPANAYVRVAFRVGHGCRGAPTTRLAIMLPEGVTIARPQPKPGWRLAERGVGDPIVWEGGPLADQHYDEFVALIRTPDRPGATLRFPAVQGCEGRESRWEGAQAPVLRLVPAP